ncbi:hypothetical protein IBQ15_002643 [Enterococcus faecalis]|nr:hypothetical protein [Enterococcus faecalis]
MFRKSKLVCVIATLLLGVSTFVISGVSVYASDFEEDSVEQDFTIETNAKWDAFEKELSFRIANSNSNNIVKRSLENVQESGITKQELQELIIKYDGAERTIRTKRAAAFSEKFVNGGYNAFADNKSGMVALRDELGTTATLLQANGTLGGAIAGGPAGALIGLVRATILATYFRNANGHMKEWIAVGSSKGGIRITVTDEFPIAQLDTVEQSPIKVL